MVKIVRKFFVLSLRLRVLLMAAGLSVPAIAQVATQGAMDDLAVSDADQFVHMALLHNGQVLIASGFGNLPSNTNLEAAVCNPQTGAITTQPLGWDMFCDGMAILPDGRPFSQHEEEI